MSGAAGDKAIAGAMREIARDLDELATDATDVGNAIRATADRQAEIRIANRRAAEAGLDRMVDGVLAIAGRLARLADLEEGRR